MKEILEEHWHHLPDAEVIELLETDLNRGLDTFEVGHRQAQFGTNAITQKKGTSPLVLFLMQFHQPLVYILLAAVVITSLLGEWVDSGVIFGVVLVNAVIGFIQEAKAVKAIEALAQSLTTTATVIRCEERRQIPATELVPGDIVLLQSGDKVPADMRLLTTRELQIDESALTGESVPVQKQNGLLPHDTLLADRLNMAYSSTLVTYGIATGVVVATGNSTEIGRINELIASADILTTPLTKKIARFSGLLLYVILGLATITFVVGILRGESWLEMFMAVVALAVGAIPEGLPAAVTITLAIGVAKMARRNAIIRKLPAVETLGSTTVICSDKTGTLTQNQMTVQELYAGGDLFLFSGTGYAPEGQITRDNKAIALPELPALRECLISGLLCNDASLLRVDDEWRVEGDPTEAALVVAARKAGLERDVCSADLPRLDAIPFESQYQYMATEHGTAGYRVIYLKGSVESVLDRCSNTLSRTGELLPNDPGRCLRAAAEMAGKGLRVLAFARLGREISSTALGHGDVAGGLTFLGLQGMIDPPRPEAVEAVRACQGAGIQVKMITGDHVITAAAIARQIGLLGDAGEPGEPLALNGRDLAALSDAELIGVAQRSAVFARVAPEQKLRLVEALQASGNIVAMTGDGVNDAPALRQADIGVAMGITGTEVAKEAADMLLTDDNFSSIEAAVEEGRGVYDNLVKFITWTLPTNLGEGLVILAAVFAGVELPILPVQILWINMTTAVLLGLMLSFEPKEPRIMQRPPIDPQKPLLTRELVIKIWIVGFLLLVGSFGLFEWELQQGSSVAVARTCAVNLFVFGELFYLFNCRSLRHSIRSLGFFSNRWLLLGVGIMILLQLLFTYLPVMQNAFGSQSIGLRHWGLIIGTSFTIYVVIEIEKWFRRGQLARTEC
ncbi:cation-transporting P-type ATPase [Geomobilimonas luticola]|uniref:Cation-transporting P-type ATPase n=1 Tax=Geomobilimonas luticola TaxID=1114878 RepID=A0ABS5S9G1_9BACT|nr:cation-transporting P-type ATPase [Geomobilimonas luticola]MBT0652014.1 cation-transporting P-type ATPase [Geomobilimonas luticola]